jgi:hypothetical protein
MSCPDTLHDYEDWFDDAPEAIDLDEPECEYEDWFDDFQGEEEFA